MRFLVRSLSGFALIISAAGLLFWGVWTFQDARSGAGGGGPARSGPEERVFAVELATVALGPVTPRILAFGEIESWRTLELRASSGGYLVELDDRFRDGAAVSEGDLLFRIDPDEFSMMVDDADSVIEEAEADLAEAKQAVEIARQELQAAEMQRDLRQTSKQRREDLRARGVSTAAELEEAEMALSSAEQGVAVRQQAILAAELKIERAALRLRRARLSADDARRTLAETEHRAPFDGLLADVTASLGALATPNERLALLIDPKSLEVAFRVTNAQFARLIDERGALKPIPVAVTLELDDAPLTVVGVLDRASAQIGDGETGRLLYARLDLDRGSVLRPGDFVSVSIDEPALADVARIPSSAVTEAGEMLLVDDEDRLRAFTVTILRREGDEVIVAGAPNGARYVKARAPQLGAGVKVRAVGAPEIVSDASDHIEIDPNRRDRLIGFVEQAQRMPADRKMRVLKALRSGRAPAEMLERLEARMDSAGG